MRFILSSLFCLLFSAIQAQNRSITFQVDMSGLSLNGNGLHIAGNFQDEAGFASDWNPGATQMTSAGGTIYSVTVNIPDGIYEYKIINGNSWGNEELVPAIAQVGYNNNSNRWLLVSGDTTLAPVTFGGSAPSGMKAVQVIADLSQQTAINPPVHIAGNFQNWNPASSPMAELNPGSNRFHYLHYDSLNAQLEFKFINGNSWSQAETVPSACSQNNNRAYSGMNDFTYEACFGACGTCAAPNYNLTLQVDLRNEANFNPATDQVDVVGDFNNWPANFNAASQMTDVDGDTIYSLSLSQPAGAFNYKARFHNGAVNWEGGSNKLVNITGDTLVPVRCFGRDTLGPCFISNPSPLPDSSFVTVLIDMRAEAGFNPGIDTVDLAGPFNNWSGNFDPAYQLTDLNNDSIYELTVYAEEPLFEFKARYHNGSVNWEQSNNQVISFSADTILAVRCFGVDTAGACYIPPVVPVPDSSFVTVQIDMRAEAGFNPSSDTVDLAGNFNNWSGNFDPAYQLTDANNDSVYDLTIYAEEPLFEFKARYHNGSVNWEQSNNQQVSFSNDTILALRCFGVDTAGACYIPPVVPVPDSSFVTVQIDMRAEAGFNPGVDTVDLAGNFNNWSGNFDPAYQLTDANNDSVYDLTIYAEEPLFEFKARYHNGIVNWEQSNNQLITFTNDTILNVRCFGVDTAGACYIPPVVPAPDSSFVTVQIDMRTEAGFNPSSDTVDLAGPFNNWSGSFYPAYQLTDLNNDSIYELTVYAEEPLFEFKARYHNGSVNWEQSNNQVVSFSADTILAVRCFGVDTAGACYIPPVVPVPDSSFVTVQIDMRAEAGFDPSSDTVDLAGNFNNWSGSFDAAYQLTDANNDSVYDLTVYAEEPLFEFKARYHNGIVNWEQSNNQQISFSNDTILAVRCFGVDTSGACYIPPVVPVPDSSFVTVKIDMRAEAGFNPSSDTVDLAGNFNNWSGSFDAAYQLTDLDNDSVYELTVYAEEPLFEFKARYHNGIVNWELSNNQQVSFSADTILVLRCFGVDTAGACYIPPVVPVPDSSFITVQIDMRAEAGFNPGVDTVDLAGPFNNWSGSFDPAYQLTDLNNDSIYELSVYAEEPLFEFKARYHNGIVNWEQSNNQQITFTADTILAVRCFGVDTAGACYIPPVVPVPDSSFVTVQIDMRAEAGFNPSSDTVDLAGNFNNWSGSFDPNYQLTDLNNDSIYDLTVYAEEPLFEFKARYHNGSVNWEQSNNQQVSFSADTILAIRCFGVDTAGACYIPPVVPDSSFVTVQIDMRAEASFNPSSDTVDLAGPFNNWSGNFDPAYQLTDLNNDSIYELTVYAEEPLFEFKARYHNGSVNWEQSNNQLITFTNDTILIVRCFGVDTAGACYIPPVVPVPDSSFVTVQIDMRAEAGFNPSSDTVDLAGPFNNWSGSFDPAYQLTDANNDSVYELTIYAEEPLFEFKARYHNGIVNWEQSNNQQISFSNDTILAVRCFGVDTSGACYIPPVVPVPDSSFVTVQIDMRAEAGFDPSSDTVDLAGNFNNWSGNFDPAYQLTDLNNDSIYDLTVYAEEPLFEFKARYHNGIVNWEQSNNQQISFSNDTILAVRCFGVDTAGACYIPPVVPIPDSSFVTVQIDMRAEAGFDPSSDTVDIAGPFNGWTGNFNSAYQLADANNDSIYELTVYAEEPLFEFKARYHNGIVNWEQSNNQQISFSNDTILAVRCFGVDTAGACYIPPVVPVPDSSFVTMQIDMRAEAGFNPSSDTVDIAGPFNNWSGNFDPAYQLTDLNNDSIYELTVYAEEPFFEFKARYHNGSVNWEQSNNQQITFTADTILAVRCFSVDTSGACYIPPVVPVPDSSFVTVQIDMRAEAGFNPSSDTVDLAGNFNNWSGNFDPAYQLTDANNDSIYDLTIYAEEPLFEFKARYHNGSVNWEQSNNQQITFTADTILAVRCFSVDTSGACYIPPVVPVPDSSFVTVQIDMRAEAGFDPSSDTVDIAGPFNGWTGNFNSAYQLTDANNDSIYDLTIYAEEPLFEFKARYHNGIVNWEQSNNQLITFTNDTILNVRCFGVDTAGACYIPPVVPVPDSSFVTVQIDMRAEAGFDPSSDTVDIAGPFNGWTGNFNSAYQLTDANNDSVYDLTIYAEEPLFEFKVRYHNGSVNWEQSNNQQITFTADTILAVRCFGVDTVGACYIPPVVPVPDSSFVTVQIDMRTEAGFNPSSDTVDLTGPFNNWSGSFDPAYQLTDANNDSIYDLTIYAEEPLFEFKARYHNGSVNWEQSNNQQVSFSNDTILALRCFGVDTAGACYIPPVVPVPDSSFVTVQIDMRAEAGFDPSSDTVDLAGPFNNWSGSFDPAYQLTDLNNNSIYELSVYAEEPHFEFKARYHNGSVNWEQSNNQQISFSADTILALRCFGVDTAGACYIPPVVPVPDSSFVTVQIDMRAEAGFNPSSDTVDLAGNFNNWSGNFDPAYQLTDANNDSIYDLTIYAEEPLFEFKARYHNGSVNWEQSNNQQITFTADTILAVRCFSVDTSGACYIPPVVPVPDSSFVTVQIDMRAEAGFDPSSDTVDLAGNFNNWSGSFDPAYQLTDLNNDSIYELSVYAEEPLFEFKVRYHNGSVNWEQSNNQVVSFSADTILALRCFDVDTAGACYIPPVVPVPDSSFVTVQIDMRAEAGFTPGIDTVDLAGNFNNWSGSFDPNYQLTDLNNNSIYELTVYAEEPLFEFKARYHNGSVNWEQSNNQQISFSADTSLALRCFGVDTAGACYIPPVVPVPDSSFVTVQIDMRAEAGFNPSSDTVDLAGPFNNWSGNFDAAYQLTDLNNDSIYELSVFAEEPLFEFKARYHNGSVNWEQSNNRQISFSADTILAVRCFSVDTAGACYIPPVVPVPDSSFVTIQIDMRAEAGFTPGIDTVDIAGNFNNWSGNFNSAYQLTDANNDSIYDLTVYAEEPLFEFKARYHNGIVNWEQSNNQQITFTADTILAVRCFGVDTAGACYIPPVVPVPDSSFVTVQIDMRAEAGFNPSSDTVDLAGNFNNWSGSFDAAYQLTDANNDSIYDLTIYAEEPLFEFKARYHNGSVNWEQSNNQLITFTNDTILNVRCFGVDSVGPCFIPPSAPDTFYVTVRVDLRDEPNFNPATDSVDIAGPFNNWPGNFNTAFQMTDADGDTVYEYTLYAPEPNFDYKARFHNGIGTNWEPGINKNVTFNSDTTMPVRCFGNDNYGPCIIVPDTFFVTLQVDMSRAPGFNATTDSVDLVGVFNGWPNSFQAATKMTDPDGDLIYEHTLYVPEPNLEYKARFHNGSGINWETGANKFAFFNSDTLMPVRCFNSDTAGTCPIPPLPVYPIATISSTNAGTGIADSLNVVCAIRGTVYSIDFDDNAGYQFYVYDNTGGINVFSFNDVDNYSLTPGDSLYLEGEVIQFRGLIEFDVDSIEVLATGLTLKNPAVVTSLNESTEGEYVELQGFNLINANQWPSSGQNANVDITNGIDTLLLRIDDATNIDGTPAPLTSFDVQGAGSQFSFAANLNDGYQLLPSSISDFNISPPPVPTINFAQSNYSVSEAGAGLQVHLLLSPQSSSTESIQVVFTAFAGMNSSDYLASPSPVNDTLSLSIPAGSDTVSFSLSPVNDTQQEGNETLSLSLVNASSGISLGSLTQSSFTIIDDDQPIQIPSYAIGDIDKENANGIADSLSVYCKLSGIVSSIDFDGNTGYQFYIYDNTGAINVFSSSDVSAYSNPSIGDQIEVIGEIGQFNGLIQIEADSINHIASGQALITPSVEFNLGEFSESRLIRLNGWGLINPGNWPSAGNSANLNITNGRDTLVMRIDSDTDIDGTPVPSGPFDLIGIGSQFDNQLPYLEGYQILPRSKNDIIPIVLPQLAITEVMVSSGHNAQLNGQWFEILNTGNTIINLGSLSWSNNALALNHSINTNYSLSPGRRALFVNIVGNDSSWVNIWKQKGNGLVVLNPGVELSGFSNLALNGDQVNVLDNNYRVLASVRYTAADVITGYSLEYNNQGQPLGSSTVGVNGAYTSLGGDVGSPGNISAVSIAEHSSGLSIYPNPTTGAVYVENGMTNKKQIEVFNGTGQILKKINSHDDKTMVDLKDLPAGVYYLHYADDNHSETFKVLLQKQ